VKAKKKKALGRKGIALMVLHTLLRFEWARIALPAFFISISFWPVCKKTGKCTFGTPNPLLK